MSRKAQFWQIPAKEAEKIVEARQDEDILGKPEVYDG